MPGYFTRFLDHRVLSFSPQIKGRSISIVGAILRGMHHAPQWAIAGRGGWARGEQ